jgi:hypothetical protein
MKIIELIEALSTRKRAEKGQVPFKKSSLSDAHINSMVSDLSRRTGVPEKDIMDELEKTIKKYDLVGQYSPRLYNTIIQNAAENAAFNQIESSSRLQKLDLSDIKFEPRTFSQLIKLVQQENQGTFLPIKPKGEYKPLYRIAPIVVPSKLPAYEKFNGVTTAAASNRGEFIFNKEFMQKLIYYATVAGIKPQGKKYESNGGPIPDNYAYIEFLIMHELLHYRFGDHNTSLQFKKYSHTAHNWAMDFRINYILVKNGYEQLPMGLFSDDLNFDRPETKNYRLLIKAVQDEFDKLPGNLIDWLEVEFSSDEHAEPNSQGQKGPPVKIVPPTVNPGDVVVMKGPGYPNKARFVKVIKVYNDGTVDVEEVDDQTKQEITDKLRKAGKIK